MIDVLSGVAGGLAFLIGLGILYWAILKFTSAGDDPHDTESTDDRLSVGSDPRHRRVGFRGRVSRQTPMTKAVLASVVVLAVYLAVAIYQVAATGRPTEAIYAEYAEWAGFGLVCVTGGVWFKAKQDAKSGEIQITLEREEGNKRRVVRFDRSNTQLTDDGTTLVPQLKDHQALGLFWRPKLNADDPKRRDADHRLPDDLIFWEVPDDDSAVWDELTGEVSVRASEIREVNNPGRVADYEIVPSERKSKSEIRQLENDKTELEEELKSERVLNAILSEQLSEIEDVLTNEEQAIFQRLEQAKDLFEPEENGHRYDERDRQKTASTSD
ncbi:hypothetical protein [Natronosalvus halobius]|uniref:hypothetical protein n=1 Tax=Natronosalvus halobius TaxID=2953746 RepID=UPI00209FB207|nr:hypothetical protein [Natronosalvus halobius]USZ73787.1 hypothetical protein NGM15_18445 [Natronosalvus halobius]